MESRALGKGLSALIPEKSDLAEAITISDYVAYVKTSKVRGNSYQPRLDYDHERLEELKASIRENGVLQPILVREVEDGYEVIAGERRLRAATELQLEEVPVFIKKASDQEAFVLALVENIQRQDLNAIEEAQAFKRLLEEFHFTQEDIAKAVGKDRSTISNTIRLLKLPQEIQKSVFSGQLSMGHARALLSIEDVKEQMDIFLRALDKGFSVRELENITKTELQSSPRRKKMKARDRSHDLVFLEEDLQQVLGTKVRIQAQKKRGRIVIEYYSTDDLERIMHIIKR